MSVSLFQGILLVCNDSDMEFWADSESSDDGATSSEDEDLSEAVSALGSCCEGQSPTQIENSVIFYSKNSFD